MRCPRCDAHVSDKAARCSFCGQDLSLIHYAERISNAYYNKGIEKAHVRDLSGAIDILKKSLQYNKKNTNARNLLGLVYYEKGETVAALSEWVLSKYLQPEDNLADYFMETVQKNQTALDATNQTIKKYNAALAAAKAGNEDLAIIQLKKVVSLNPRFVRAQQLLALLYIYTEDYAKAAKCLHRARRIDFNNTTTLRYLQEIGDRAQSAEKKNTGQTKKAPKKDPLENVIPVGSYKEEKKSLMPAVQVIIGVIIGIAVCFFLIRPTLLKTGTDGENLSDVNEQISVQATKITALEKERDSLREETEDLQQQIKDGDTKAQNQLKAYEALLNGIQYYMDEDRLEAAAAVSECKKSDFGSAEAKKLYTLIGNISDEEIATCVADGKREMYGSYDQALATFKKVLAADKDNQEAMLYTGRCYQRKGKNKTAKKWYKKAIAVNDTTTLASQAETWLSEIS